MFIHHFKFVNVNYVDIAIYYSIIYSMVINVYRSTLLQHLLCHIKGCFAQKHSISHLVAKIYRDNFDELYLLNTLRWGGDNNVYFLHFHNVNELMKNGFSDAKVYFFTQ